MSLPDPPPVAVPAQAVTDDVWPGVLAAAGVLAATAAGSALAGVLAGLAWSAVAPRAVLVVASHGVAYVVNTETSAFIVADAWFSLLTAAAGLICGLAGYLLAVRRYGPIAAAVLVAGGAGGSLLAMWTGQQQGLSAFQTRLAASPAGTELHDPLTLGAHGAVAFWPLFTGLVIVLIEMGIRSRQRRQAQSGAVAGSQAGPA